MQPQFHHSRALHPTVNSPKCFDYPVWPTMSCVPSPLPNLTGWANALQAIVSIAGLAWMKSRVRLDQIMVMSFHSASLSLNQHGSRM